MNVYDVIVRPILSEKLTGVSVSGQYGFVVRLGATKADIKVAIEKIFKVRVRSVNTLIRKGKVKRFRGRIGRRSDEKRAYVRIAAGDVISYDEV